MAIGGGESNNIAAYSAKPLASPLLTESSLSLAIPTSTDKDANAGDKAALPKPAPKGDPYAEIGITDELMPSPPSSKDGINKTNADGTTNDSAKGPSSQNLTALYLKDPYKQIGSTVEKKNMLSKQPAKQLLHPQQTTITLHPDASTASQGKDPYADMGTTVETSKRDSTEKAALPLANPSGLDQKSEQQTIKVNDPYAELGTSVRYSDKKSQTSTPSEQLTSSLPKDPYADMGTTVDTKEKAGQGVTKHVIPKGRSTIHNNSYRSGVKQTGTVHGQQRKIVAQKTDPYADLGTTVHSGEKKTNIKASNRQL